MGWRGSQKRRVRAPAAAKVVRAAADSSPGSPSVGVPSSLGPVPSSALGSEKTGVSWLKVLASATTPLYLSQAAEVARFASKASLKEASRALVAEQVKPSTLK